MRGRSHLYTIEHNYDREAKENKAWHWIEGYILGRNRDAGVGFTLQNMKSWEPTYYIAKAFMSGYREGQRIPYIGKIKATYDQRKVWQSSLME